LFGTGGIPRAAAGVNGSGIPSTADGTICGWIPDSDGVDAAICGWIPDNDGVDAAIGPANCSALSGSGGIEGVAAIGPAAYGSTGIGAGGVENEEAIAPAYCAEFGSTDGSEGTDGAGSGAGNWGGWIRIAIGTSCLGFRLCTIPGIFFGIPQNLLLKKFIYMKYSKILIYYSL
jgi:hypothetical protein